jgi:hypothetical protein
MTPQGGDPFACRHPQVRWVERVSSLPFNEFVKMQLSGSDMN